MIASTVGKGGTTGDAWKIRDEMILQTCSFEGMQQE